MMWPAPYCDYWTQGSLSLYIVGDAMTIFAYWGIPALLIITAWRLRKTLSDIPPWLNHVLYAGAAFILSCGNGHLVDIGTLWSPHPWLKAGWHFMTGMISLYFFFRVFLLMRIWVVFDRGD